MAYKTYSEAQEAEALIVLAVNKYDLDKTAKETGVSASTLKRWAKHGTKKGVGDLLERAIERMLMHIPTDWRGNDWAIALGILMDKWLLMQGEATTRTETLVRDMQNLSPEQKSAVIAEADAILARAREGSRLHQGDADHVNGHRD